MISFRAYLVIVSKSLSYPTQTQTNYRECLKSFKMVNKIRKSLEVKYENIFFLPNINLRNFMSMKLKVLLATYVYSLNIQKYCRKRILCTSTYVLHILIKCVFSILDTNVLCSFNFKPQSTKVNGRIYFKNETKDMIFMLFNNSESDKKIKKQKLIF